MSYLHVLRLPRSNAAVLIAQPNVPEEWSSEHFQDGAYDWIYAAPQYPNFDQRMSKNFNVQHIFLNTATGGTACL